MYNDETIDILLQEMENMEVKPQKRGPGRPPSKPKIPVLTKHGIVNTPDNSQNCLEFVYDNPKLFKTLFAYYKDIKAKTIIIKMKHDRLEFYTRDHEKKTRVVAVISGANANWYYCAEEMVIAISREKVEGIFNSIDKKFNKITFVYSYTERDLFKIVFKNYEINTDSIYRINIMVADADLELFNAIDDILGIDHIYKLSFTLEHKIFKKKIEASMSQGSKIISIVKTPDSNLQFSFNTSSLTYNDDFGNSDSIALVNKLENCLLFRIELQLEQMKPITKSVIGDTVTLHCSEDRDLLIVSASDIIRTYTFIKLN